MNQRYVTEGLHANIVMNNMRAVHRKILCCQSKARNE